MSPPLMPTCNRWPTLAPPATIPELPCSCGAVCAMFERYVCASAVHLWGHALLVLCLCSCNFVPAHSALPAVLITYRTVCRPVSSCLFAGVILLWL